MPPILEVRGLEKKYGDFAAVNGVSFSVEEGEVFGLLGPNGAGKTTLISMLTGILPPTSGSAAIGGFEVPRQMAQAKHTIGLVPQDLALYPTLSARANLDFFGRIYGLSGKELRDRIDDVLRIVALTDRADEPVERYSGGMKRRVNIAAGLLHQPRLLFLDEPTVGVDPQSRNHIFESVLRLNRERGMSIVYTSHYMEEVELLCSRVAIVDRGQVIAVDTVKNLTAMLSGVIHIGLRQVDESLLAEIGALPAVKTATVATPTAPPAPAAGEKVPEEATPPVPGYTIVKIEASHAQHALVDVLALLRDRDAAIVSLQVLEPNLENVFLHLTGKRLRE